MKSPNNIYRIASYWTFVLKLGILSSTGIWDWLISDYYNIIAAGNGQPGYSIPCLEQLSHIAPSRLPSSTSVMMLKALVLNPVNKHWLKSCVLSEWILLHSIAKWFELWPSQISNCCLLLNMIILWHWSTWKICHRKYLFCRIWFWICFNFSELLWQLGWHLTLIKGVNDSDIFAYLWKLNVI